MKKSTCLAAVVAAALGGSVFAAELTLYGIVDLGLVYQSVDDDIAGQDRTDSLEMKSGFQSGSRFGFKGIEQISPDLAVGFVLENGFTADDGALAMGGRLFGRESQLFVRTNLGELSAGRVGQLNSGSGTYALTAGFSPFATTWGQYSVTGTNFMFGYERMDNVLTYKSPTWAGLNIYAQYSFDADTKDELGEEGKSSANRYVALGVAQKIGGLQWAAVIDRYLYSNLINKIGNEEVDDGWSVSIGGNYNMEFVRLYFGAEYFDNGSVDFMDRIYDITDELGNEVGSGYYEGFGIMLGATTPLAGGNAKLALGYMTAEDVLDSEMEYDKYGVSVGYEYPFSKSLNLYSILSYNKFKVQNADFERKPDAVEAAVGLRYRF